MVRAVVLSLPYQKGEEKMPDTKRILIVEDEPDILKVAIFRLRKAGYEVTIATDGQKGLEAVKRDKPALILLDKGLPVMNGSEVCKKLKADEELKKIPVIMFTATVENIEDYIKSVGADDFIVKPFEPQDLFSKIEKYMGT